MKIAFEQVAFADFTAWAEQDRKIDKRIVTLILDIARNPHQGIGKPEPLMHELRGYWSRRITERRSNTLPSLATYPTYREGRVEAPPSTVLSPDPGQFEAA